MQGIRFLRAFVQPFTWRFAWRNLRRHPRRTGIVVTAVSVGLGGILLTMAVNYGLVFQMVETSIATELGHIQIHGRGYDENPGLEISIDAGGQLFERVFAEHPGVAAWAPRVRSEGLVFSPRASVGVSLVGIDPPREAGVSVIAESVVRGEFLNGARRRLLLGERLAGRLQVEVGDKVVVSAQDVHGDMTGEAYRVGGLFRTASRELDESAVFVRIEEGQQLLALGDAVSEFVLVAEDHAELEALKGDLIDRLGEPFEVRTWKEIRPFLVAMIEVFDRTGWVVYAAVFVAMAFGIANVLLMSVFERFREIGIFMAIGMQPARLVATVVAESLVLTLVGVSIGLLLGVGLVWLLGDGIDLSRYAEGLTSVGVGTRIVPVTRAQDFFVPVAVAVITAVLSSLWPALRAVRIRPAEAVRHI